MAQQKDNRQQKQQVSLSLEKKALRERKQNGKESMQAMQDCN